MDAAAKRDLHDAIWRSSGGFDLVLAPVLIALLGLWIDAAAGTRPVFMLAFLAFGTVGAVLKVYYDYQRGMTQAATGKTESQLFLILPTLEPLQARITLE